MRALLLCATLLALSAPHVEAELRTQRDRPYADTKNARQTLDIYSPPEGKGHPVMFWIHGGGWQHGDKAEVNAKPQAFVERGWVFVSVNYRLHPEVSIGQMAGDVAQALRWTRDHVRDYGGDRDTLFVMGHSAGAQLAALICTDEQYLKAAGLSLSQVKGCVPVDGDTYDVPLQVATVEERRANSYRSKFGDAESQKALSPITHVAKGKHRPPFLILHVAEHPETRMQSQRLVEALRAAGTPADAYPAPGTDHVRLDAELGKPGDAPTQALFDFLDRTLKGK